MDVDDPDLEAFEFNPCRILRVREIGKIAALMSDFCPDGSDLPLIGVSSKDNASPTAANHLIASPIRTIHRMITKHPQNGISNFMFTLLPPAGQGKLMKTQIGWRGEQYLSTVPVPVHSMESFYNSAAEPDRELLKLLIRGYVQAKSASRRQWRKTDR